MNLRSRMSNTIQENQYCSQGDLNIIIINEQVFFSSLEFETLKFTQKRVRNPFCYHLTKSTVSLIAYSNNTYCIYLFSVKDVLFMQWKASVGVKFKDIGKCMEWDPSLCLRSPNGQFRNVLGANILLTLADSSLTDIEKCSFHLPFLCTKTCLINQ